MGQKKAQSKGIGMGPLRSAFKKFGTLLLSFNQLISVSAQYCRAIAKLIIRQCAGNHAECCL